MDNKELRESLKKMDEQQWLDRVATAEGYRPVIATDENLDLKIVGPDLEEVRKRFTETHQRITVALNDLAESFNRVSEAFIALGEFVERLCTPVTIVYPPGVETQEGDDEILKALG